ncbi:MAG: class I SAM-dependent methyltransferase [Candidatus Didemnitutus sp.]|nr:class I SAM-dependent methyltransferase [Candidatus Didemnitutus sp.]
MSLETLKPPLRRFRIYRALRFAWHFATDRVFRRDYLRRLRPARGQFQFRSFTREERYPRIFAFLGERLAARADARVLSFGCATGEEAFSLRRRLPQAFIKGVDVNALDIAVAERRRAAEGAAGERMEFTCAADAAGESADSYDAVLCLAVFQHSALKDEARESCAAFIRFGDFERVLGGLARCLKPGGYLAFRWANFRFEDAACASDFEPVLTLPPGGAPHPRFDRDNRRLAAEPDRQVVWRKRGG